MAPSTSVWTEIQSSATAVSVVGLVLAAALLWTGFKRLHASSLLAAVLSAVELAGFVLTLATLGWAIALAVVIGCTTLGFVIYGVAGAMHIEAELTYAATQADVEPVELKDVNKRLSRVRELRAMGPKKRALLIRLLAEQHRDPGEIEEMAVPIGLLWLVHKSDLRWLVGRFDQVLRLYGEPATASMNVADTLTVSTQQAAATFEEMVNALVVAGGGVSDEADPVESRV